MKLSAAARGLHFSVQGYQLPALKLVLQVGAVKPHAFDLAQALPTVISKMGMRRVRSRAMPRTSPMRLAISPGVRSSMACGTQAVFIAKRQMVEQIFNGGDSLFQQRLGDAGSNALDELKRRFRSQQHIRDAISGAGRGGLSSRASGWSPGGCPRGCPTFAPAYVG